MKFAWIVLAVAVAAGSFSMTACAREADRTGSAQALPVALVHKSPSCGCCGLWIAHLEQAGFKVKVDDTDNMNPVKERLGIPHGKGSCHTAEIGGYVVEGHVPASDIKRLLRERPRIRGLVLPGMPMGSPGMESPDGSVRPYTVEQLNLDGTTEAYSVHH